MYIEEKLADKMNILNPGVVLYNDEKGMMFSHLTSTGVIMMTNDVNEAMAFDSIEEAIAQMNHIRTVIAHSEDEFEKMNLMFERLDEVIPYWCGGTDDTVYLISDEESESDEEPEYISFSRHNIPCSEPF